LAASPGAASATHARADAAIGLVAAVVASFSLLVAPVSKGPAAPPTVPVLETKPLGGTISTTYPTAARPVKR